VTLVEVTRWTAGPPGEASRILEARAGCIGALSVRCPVTGVTPRSIGVATAAVLGRGAGAAGCARMLRLGPVEAVTWVLIWPGTTTLPGIIVMEAPPPPGLTPAPGLLVLIRVDFRLVFTVGILI